MHVKTNEMPNKNIYWTEDHAVALQKVYEIMKRKGIRADYRGKPNASVIIEWALRQVAMQNEAEKGGKDV